MVTQKSLFVATIFLSMSKLWMMSIQMHFDDAYGAYFDFGNHTEKVCCSVISV